MLAACAGVSDVQSLLFVEMNQMVVAFGRRIPTLPPFVGVQKVDSRGGGWFDDKKKLMSQSRRFVGVRAGLSGFSTSRLGLDPQIFQSQESSQMLWIGPVPGDIAEIEAYCRIFRAAEQLHAAIMQTVCNPETGECTVVYNLPSEDLPMLEEKVVTMLGCMLALLNRGREEVLSGRSSFEKSFKGADFNVMDGRLPPLASFRGEMKRCCESLHVALVNYLIEFDDRSADIWRKLQRLRNVCYDAGFARSEDHPSPTFIANWSPVCLSNKKEVVTVDNCEVAFWKGGHVTEEGLNWLLDKGFKTIVDLRVEAVRDGYCQKVIEQAVSHGKVEVVSLPVEVGTAPSMEQVQQFALLISDLSKQPLYLHSQEGVNRTSAMVSRWKQYIVRSSTQSTLSRTNFKDVPEEDLKVQELQNVDTSEQLAEFLPNENGSSLKEYDRHVSGNNNTTDDSTNQSVNGTEELTTSLDDDFEGKNNLRFSRGIDPFTSQIPRGDIFSRRMMVHFLKSKKIAPRSFLDSKRERFQTRIVSSERKKVQVKMIGTDNNPQSSEPMKLSKSNGAYVDVGSVSNRSNNHDGHRKHLSVLSPSVHELNGFQGESNSFAISPTSNEISGGLHSQIPNRIQEEPNMSNGKSELVNGGTSIVEDNMCASTTGVVRVQSRKKAEMFLVRTDGFSCTREKVTESSLAFTHPSTQQQMLMWKTTPKTVLLLKKLGTELMQEAKEVASFLYHQEKMNILVEPDVHDIFARIPGFGFVQTFYSQDISDLHERVDFVACLGGDGVILHASNLFRGAVPPVVSFNLGSLGFLTTHTFEDFKQDLRAVVYGNNTLGVYITLRMRLHCEIFRKGQAVPGKIFDVLNEVVVDRGSNPYISKIECYEHNHLITKVQGDGVIVATPTGSTAYSTAAGGSMVHPNVPCMLFTPICPHSLSFRPVILPDSAQLELKIPEDARSNAWVSFDGKRRQQLSRGDSVKICMSRHPLPTVNKSDQTADWFRSLIRCLNWNERLEQRAL